MGENLKIFKCLCRSESQPAAGDFSINQQVLLIKKLFFNVQGALHSYIYDLKQKNWTIGVQRLIYTFLLVVGILEGGVENILMLTSGMCISHMINVMKIMRDDNVYNIKRNFKVSVARLAQRQSNGVLIQRSWVQFPLLCTAGSLFSNCYKKTSKLY